MRAHDASPHRRHARASIAGLRKGEGVDIPLDPRRRVRAIAVHTDPRYRGGYSVWGG